MSSKGIKRTTLSSKLKEKTEKTSEQSSDEDDSRKKIKLDKNSNEIKSPTELGVSEEVELIKNYESNRLNDDFFDEDCLVLNRKLLGKYLFRKLILNENNRRVEKLMIGKIVECEAYLGGDDKASHSSNGKMTDRTKAMYMKSGTAYVYNIYGMYCCLNISSKEAGGAVLIRAIEPISGIESMKLNRDNPNSKKSLNLKDLTSGPSKLCLAMKITKNEFNQVDLCKSDMLWLQSSLNHSKHDVSHDLKIIVSKRIGIDWAGEEAINKLYRFYVKNNIFVSVKCKQEIEYDESKNMF